MLGTHQERISPVYVESVDISTETAQRVIDPVVSYRLECLIHHDPCETWEDDGARPVAKRDHRLIRTKSDADPRSPKIIVDGGLVGEKGNPQRDILFNDTSPKIGQFGRVSRIALASPCQDLPHTPRLRDVSCVNHVCDAIGDKSGSGLGITERQDVMTVQGRPTKSIAIRVGGVVRSTQHDDILGERRGGGARCVGREGGDRRSRSCGPGRDRQGQVDWSTAGRGGGTGSPARSGESDDVDGPYRLKRSTRC